MQSDERLTADSQAPPDPIADLLAKLAAEAEQVPLGRAFHDGPLEGASIFNAYRWAERLIRRLARRQE